MPALSIESLKVHMSAKRDTSFLISRNYSKQSCIICHGARRQPEHAGYVVDAPEGSIGTQAYSAGVCLARKSD